MHDSNSQHRDKPFPARDRRRVGRQFLAWATAATLAVGGATIRGGPDEGTATPPATAQAATVPAGTAAAAPVWPLAVPAGQAVAAAEAIVRQAFAAEYAAVERPDPGTAVPGRKADLARRLLDQAALADDDPAVRWVALRDAVRLAAEGGDADAAMRAIGRAGRTFGVGTMATAEAALAALTTAGRAATSPAAARAVAAALADLIESAQAVGDHELTARAAAAAGPVAERAGDVRLRALLSAATAHVPERPAGGDGPAERTVLGRYLCTWRGDFASGLPLLAAGGDAALRSLAAADLAGTGRAGADPAALGDAWWSAADPRPAPERDAMRRRAAYWYRRGVPLPGGPVRDAAAAARLRQVRAGALAPGLIADLYEGDHFARRRGVRIDGQVDFDWKGQPPDPQLEADRFSIGWQGYVRAPAPGEYRLEVTADDGVAVQIDGRTVVDELHVFSGATFHAKVVLTGEPQPFAVLYSQVTGGAFVKVAWAPPGQTEFVPVPSSAFLRDPVWPWGPVALATEPRPAGAVAAGRPADPSPPAAGAAPTTASGSVWYHRFGQGLPWHAAQRQCERSGGHLAWILTPDQGRQLASLTGDRPSFLGGSDEDMEGRWEWTDGRRVDPDLFAWGEKEPNGGRDENFLNLSGDGTWNDTDGHQIYLGQWDP